MAQAKQACGPLKAHFYAPVHKNLFATYEHQQQTQIPLQSLIKTDETSSKKLADLQASCVGELSCRSFGKVTVSAANF